MRRSAIPTLIRTTVYAAALAAILHPAAVAQDVVVEEAVEFDIDEEVRRDIIKSLNEAGMSPAEIDALLEGFDLGGTIPSIGESADGATDATRAFGDGSPLYLPIGNQLEFDFEDASLIELPFQADGPGMLTVACFNGESPANAGIEVLLATGEQLINSRSRGSGLSEGVRLVPIGGAGEYLVRVGGVSGPITILAEWLPYPMLEGSEAMMIPAPASEEMVHLQANTQAVFSRTGDAWCQFEAQADGQINIELDGPGGDLMLTVYVDNNFEDPQLYLDNDLEGNVGHEVASFPVQAGRTYHVQVDTNRDTPVEIHSRTVFIPLPPDRE